MYCKNCGHLLNKDANFCDKCGSRVERTTEYGNVARSFVGVNMEPPAKQYKNPVFFKLAQIIGILGITIFLAIVLVGLIGYGRVYFFDGYDFTAVITWICFGFSALGGVLIILSFIGYLISRNPLIGKGRIIMSIIVLLGCAFICFNTIVLYVEEKDKNRDYNSNYSYNYNYNDNYDDYDDDLVSKTLGLSIRVNSITKSSSGNYTYVKCTITNVSSNYGTPTKYRYVKAKGVFKNSSGTVIDTDWTYAIDSAWLEPGESKQFEFMVASGNVKYATVTVMQE